NRVLRLQARGSTVIAAYVKSAAVDGRGALVLTLLAPVPYLEQLLALPPYAPLNPAIFRPDALNRTPDRWAGNGIYALKTIDPGQTITLVPAALALPTIVLRHFDNPADLREALKARTVDLAWRG